MDYVYNLPAGNHPQRQCLTLVPNSSIPEFYLPLHAFDYSKTSKNGCF